MVTEVLTGRAGYWVTVRGQDGGRPVNCADCGRTCPAPIWDYYCAIHDPIYIYA